MASNEKTVSDFVSPDIIPNPHAFQTTGPRPQLFIPTTPAGNSEPIKFDPEKIMAVATNLEQQHKKHTQSVSGIMKKSVSLMSSWDSDSAKLYKEKAKELEEQGEELAEMLLTFSQDLAKASGIYKAGEADAKQKAEALPTEGVFRV